MRALQREPAVRRLDWLLRITGACTNQEIASVSPSCPRLLCATQDDKIAANDEHCYLPNPVCYVSHDNSHDEVQVQVPGHRAQIHGARTTTGVVWRRLGALLGAVHRRSQWAISGSENCFLPSIHTFTSVRKRQTLTSSPVWQSHCQHSYQFLFNLMFTTSPSCDTA